MKPDPLTQAMNAAVLKGALRLVPSAGDTASETPPPAVPLTPAIAAFSEALRSSAEAEAQRNAQLTESLADVLQKVALGNQQLSHAVDLLKQDGPVPASAADLAAAVSALAAATNARFDLVNRNLGTIQSWLEVITRNQQTLLDALYKPVIPEYDASGKVVAAQRQS